MDEETIFVWRDITDCAWNDDDKGKRVDFEHPHYRTTKSILIDFDFDFNFKIIITLLLLLLC